MDLLESLISSGRIVDIMLAIMATEVVAVSLYRRATGRGIAFVPLILNIGAGASLMLALRAALTDGNIVIIAAWLVASLFFHVADQARRWTAPSDNKLS
ncbi:MAG: hypothetical protein AAGA44_17725 [Pseudomonadota bacterium]